MCQALPCAGGLCKHVQGPSPHCSLHPLSCCVLLRTAQLHCARLCGVDPAVLTRAAEVLALQEAGLPINRLQVGGWQLGGTPQLASSAQLSCLHHPPCLALPQEYLLFSEGVCHHSRAAACCDCQRAGG